MIRTAQEDRETAVHSDQAPPITVVLGHRSPLVAAALSTTLTQFEDMQVVVESSHAKLLALARRRKPRVVVIDHDLARNAEVGEFCRHLCAVLPDARVLVIADHQRSGGVLGRLVGLAPQVGLIATEAAPADLIAAIRQLDRGEPVLDARMALAVFAADRNPFTAREQEVLELAGAGAPVCDIAAKLHLSKGTVRNHLSRILAKTGARTRIEAVRLAQEAGWI